MKIKWEKFVYTFYYYKFMYYYKFICNKAKFLINSLLALYQITKIKLIKIRYNIRLRKFSMFWINGKTFSPVNYRIKSFYALNFCTL